jgi:heme A synthase
VILDAALALLAVVGLGWAWIRRDDMAAADRWGNVLLFLGVGLSGAAGLAGAGLGAQAAAGALALAGFYLLVVRGDGVPRDAAESDPADAPDDGDRPEP